MKSSYVRRVALHEQSIGTPECEYAISRPLLEHFVAHRLHMSKIALASIVMDQGKYPVRHGYLYALLFVLLPQERFGKMFRPPR